MNTQTWPNRRYPERPESDCRGYAAGFEALRDRSDAYLERTGSRPQVLLLPLGPLAEHNIRATFAANLLASGGIEAASPGTVTADGVAQAISIADSRASRSSAVPMPATGPRRQAWSRRPCAAGRRGSIWLAGKAVAEVDQGGRPDDYLTAKIDAVSALSTSHPIGA